MFTGLSDLSILNDPAGNHRAKGMFMEAVQDMNKVVVGDVLKQSTV